MNFDKSFYFKEKHPVQRVLGKEPDKVYKRPNEVLDQFSQQTTINQSAKNEILFYRMLD